MVKKGPIFLFCIPGEIYKGKSLEDVARDYTEMAIHAYDSFVTFDPKYEAYKEKPDFQDFALKKEDKKVFRNLFLYQQMTRVGKIFGLVNSSRHLFNPEGPSEDFLFPDLDVVEFHERKIAQVQEVKAFYESYGWSASVYDGAIRRSIWIAKKGRFVQSPQVVSTKALLNIAEEHFGYNREKLCWT